MENNSSIGKLRINISGITLRPYPIPMKITHPDSARQKPQDLDPTVLYIKLVKFKEIKNTKVGKLVSKDKYIKDSLKWRIRSIWK